MCIEITTQVMVLGAGPAGYSAAFRCSDLGLKTVIVEQYNNLGGVCLNVGCIPSKALLHIAKVIEETKSLSELGVVFNNPVIDFHKICIWKEKLISQLATGLSNMAKIRKIKVINGSGRFHTANKVEARCKDNKIFINFDHAIIAAGSHPIKIPFFPYQDSQVWDSTDALKLKEIPKNMLIIGGGIIGLEIGTIYHAFGSKIDIVEISDQIIPTADQDIIYTFSKSIRKKFNLMLETKVISIEKQKEGILVSMQDKESNAIVKCYDVILVAIGRTPNTKNLGLEKVGIKLENSGLIHVNKQLRTNISHIFAIGDIIGQPMLAHKGIHEGRFVAEIISGMKHNFNPKVIPSIAYTDPEVAWVGLTERQAKKQGINYETAIFPWTASGRALASNYMNGMTKLIFDKKTRHIIGGAVVGTNGGELLGEISLAIEMGCDVEDIALTIHAHPTLSESIGLAAEIFEGSITDLPNMKAKEQLSSKI